LQFKLTAHKNVIINGRVVTFEAGEVDTNNELEIAALSKCKGVVKLEVVKKKK
tara:strand:- start:714 stop:872 length:159 start_codon:yes stop_codon:yes gene_type:complete